MNTEPPAIFYNDNRLGPYELRERLGEGGMAVIDKVWHTGLHRFEALKLPRQRGIPTADAAFIHRLLAEARIAAGLHHPHIVTIFNISEEDAPQPYFAMEFVEGRDMGKLLKERESLPLEDVLPILGQVASALDYAHAHGVVHRDVKPSNILLKDVPPPTEAGGETLAEALARWQVKVVDFGISRALEDNSGTRLTKDGLFVGTPEYMAPEQANGGVVDGRTDLYSLGVVAYEMLCGRPPFTATDGASPVSILVKQIHDAPRPPIEHLPQLSPAVNDAILRALSKDPAARFATCAEFVTALAAVPEAAPATAGATLTAAEAAGAETGLGHEARTAAQNGGSITRPEIRNGGAATAVLTGASLEAGDSLAKPPPRAMRPRLSTLLAGLGGLVVGAWMVHTLGTRDPDQTEVAPRRAPANAALTVVEKTTHGAAPKAVAGGSPAAAAPRRRVQKRVFRAIPFSRYATRTRALLAGQQRVTRKGQAGRREVVLALTYQGQKEVARQVVSSRVVKTPRNQLELLGVRRPSGPARKRVRPAVRAVRRPAARPAAPVRRPGRARPRERRGPDAVEAIVGEILKRGKGRGPGRWLEGE